MAATQRLNENLKLLFWNVHCENHNAGRIAACLDTLIPDVALLNEVTNEHLDVISGRFQYVVKARDYLQNGVLCHLVIAAKTPLAGVDILKHGEDNKQPASWLARKMGWVEFLDTLAVSHREPGLRMVCLHLSAGCGPARRRKELEAAATHIPRTGPCLVAGDFNSFSAPWIAPFVAAPLGYRWREWFWRERQANDAWFARRGFGAAVDAITFPRFRFRMDQVYVRGINITKAWVTKSSWGSDHRPIVVELM